MSTFNLTNQVTVRANVISAQTLCRNQLLARKEFLDKMSPEKLRAYYKSGKDPVLVEIFQLYKGLDAYFDKIREEA